MYRLRRHPLPMQARFRHSLVVSFAFPSAILDRLLPPGLTVDAFGGWGLAAVAVVQTEAMRPAGMPRRVGRGYALAGYRVFCRLETAEGRRLRGLHILRSDASAAAMVIGGNLLTRYRYHRSDVRLDERDPGVLRASIATRDGADLDLVAHIARPADAPPAASPFPDLAAARRFAGPLPFTFDYERETGSIVLIEGHRDQWRPVPVAVEVRRLDFFRHPMFGGYEPVLANAFHVAGVDYRWSRGRLVRAAA